MYIKSVPGSKFLSLPCDSMHGTIWFHTINSCRFHAWNRMESYGSMHGIAWNHMIPCVEFHGRSVGHGSMHGIVWNHTDHMLPCMELHGSLMNLDPGSARLGVWSRTYRARDLDEDNLDEGSSGHCNCGRVLGSPTVFVLSQFVQGLHDQRTVHNDPDHKDQHDHHLKM